MRVRMLSTHQGASDGFTVQVHTEGFEYTVSESLAHVYIGEGWAVEAEALPAVDAIEEVAPEVGPEVTPEVAPENKEHKRRGRPRKG